MKSGITRENLKNNFLKNVIIRFDYIGITEVELEAVLTKIKPILREHGYDRLRNEYTTELDFQLQDPEQIEITSIPVREVRQQKVYVFTNDNSGLEFRISPLFAFISVNNKKYIPFSEYSKTLIEVMNILKQDVCFFSGTRFGIRKINQCIMMDISRINDYFEPRYFQIFNSGKDGISKIHEAKDCFSEEKHNVNLMRTIIAGEYDHQVAYQVILDTDIYVTDYDGINELIENSDIVNLMNEELFEFYKDALTEGFIVNLGKDVLEDCNIIGVEKNE